MTVKEKDFIQLNYTGSVEDGFIFDTTEEKVAKDNGLYQKETSYGPVTICVGQRQILPGLEQALIGATVGKHKIMLSPEQGFGRKNAKLIQLIAMSKFKKEGMQPQPGLQINVDGQMGVVKRVGGGRVLVDFNHPLAGQQLTYDIEILKTVAEAKEQVESLVQLSLGKETKVEVTEKKATILTKQKIPEQYQEMFIKNITELVPAIKEVEIKEAK